MPDVHDDQTWGTAHLVEFLAALSGQLDERAATLAATERMIESLDAEIGLVLDADGSTEVVVGLSAQDARIGQVIDTAFAGHDAAELRWFGPVRVASAALAAGADSARLVVARQGTEEFRPKELLLLRGMAWVLDLARRQLQVLTQLDERQRVLERLARVQRDIAAHAPLPEVFDAVTESALSLVGSDFALLHLFDRVRADPVAVSSAVKGERPSPQLCRLSAAVASDAGKLDDVVRRTEIVARWLSREEGQAADTGTADGARAVLGAPVRENGEVVGGLVVLSPAGRPGFADAQVQALLTFADQVSVALSDARTQLAAQHAVRDPVTGLPNRVLFLDQLEGALATTDRVHVMFLDLDRFKQVNDTHGHAVGDELLRRVGRRLRETLRAGEQLARFGGDEFAVLVEDQSDDGARRCAERLLAAMGRPYLVGAAPIGVGASIGVTRAGPTATAAQVLRNADVAMYRAKHAGGGQIVTYDVDLHPAPRPLGLGADLRQAMGTDAVRVAFQPIVDLRDGRIHAAEALARWDHPSRGPLVPADFLPMAEETGLIVPLGRQILTTACAQAAAWAEVVEDGIAPSVTVNLSARQLHDPGLLADVRGVLADTRLDPDRMVLEVAENTMISDLDGVLQVMLRLRELGVRLAIDDFGTGYSALSYLRIFPVEILKIAKSIVDSVVEPWQGREFVQAIVRLAHSLSMTPIAKGVESPAQVAALIDSGCAVGQGYHLGRPMSSADVIRQATTDPDPPTAEPTAAGAT